MPQSTKDRLLSALVPFGQEHLLQFWGDLDEVARGRLAEQIEGIDLELIARLYAGQVDEPDWGQLASRAEPPPAFRLDSEKNRFSPQQARQCGEETLRQGRLGVVLVAGGQGTRLGFPHPKGMFPLGPVSKRSLFQIHVERQRAVAQRYGANIPLYLMTSPATHEETVAFLKKHDRFGLDEDDLRIFCQGTMPAVDADSGRLLLAEPGRLALSPDGHGGTLAALEKSHCLNHARQRGIEHLYYLQVDNPLVSICDPEFVGYHLLSTSEMSTQVIAKKDPSDRVGNLVMIDGRAHIIEYSDIPAEAAQRRNADSSLFIWAGSIAVHLFDLGFLSRMSETSSALPFHRARKKVAYIDSHRRRRQPAEPNAVKFERFIFDLLPSARNPIAVEVSEEEGFAPLKNASGTDKDTPEITRAAMVRQHTRWLHAAGATVASEVAVEINPRFALDETETADRVRPGLQVRENTYFSGSGAGE